MESTFHLALPCKSIDNTSGFYKGIFGATIGRKTNKWIDINLFGNQLTFTEVDSFSFKYKNYKLNDISLPSFHFGIILSSEKWNTLFETINDMGLTLNSEVTFHHNNIGEFKSFFVEDPNGYKVEFKSFKNPQDIFTEQK